MPLATTLSARSGESVHRRQSSNSDIWVFWGRGYRPNGPLSITYRNPAADHFGHPGRMDIRLRPIREHELDLLHGFSQDPAVSGHMWAGFRPVLGLAREYTDQG